MNHWRGLACRQKIRAGLEKAPASSRGWVGLGAETPPIITKKRPKMNLRHQKKNMSQPPRANLDPMSDAHSALQAADQRNKLCGKKEAGLISGGGGVAPLGVAVAVALPVSVPVALGVSVSVSVAARRPVSGETCKKERVFSPPPGASREGPTSRVQNRC